MPWKEVKKYELIRNRLTRNTAGHLRPETVAYQGAGDMESGNWARQIVKFKVQ